MLKDKVAVIYGAGGDVGGAVARAFAREGAKLFLSGRNLRKVEAVAADVTGRGGVAEAAQVDALDEQAVDKYVGAVAEKAGTIDISFCAISIARRVAEQGPASGSLGRAVCASHRDLYAGEFPHGAERGAPDGREAIRRHPDDHRHDVSPGIPERRRHCAGVCGGRRADPHPLRRARAAGGPGGVPDAERDAGDGNDPRKFRALRTGGGRHPCRVSRAPREHDPPQTPDHARGARQRRPRSWRPTRPAR